MTIKYPQKDLFYPTLTKRVEAYFDKNTISETGDWRLYLKSILLFFTTVIVYTTIMWHPPNIGLWYTLEAFLGILFALIGFNVMHDASHKSYASQPWINTLVVQTATMMGASSSLWIIKHTVIHHTFTNTTESNAACGFIDTNISMHHLPIHSCISIGFGSTIL
jgi:linoleoyl-CoA desaturase